MKMEGSPSTVNTTKGIRLASWEPEAVRESRYPKTPQGCSNITAALVRHDNQLQHPHFREVNGVVLTRSADSDSSTL
jgi:hypothetical protein